MVRRTIAYQIQINIDDLSRNYQLVKKLTFSRQPLETLPRMMLRIIAWSMYANENLVSGSCKHKESELAIADPDTGDTKLRIEFGLPNEKQLTTICNKAQSVVLFTHNDKAASKWKKRTLNKLHPLHNLAVIHINDEILLTAANLSSRNMDAKVRIENGEVRLSLEQKTIVIEPQTWKIEGL